MDEQRACLINCELFGRFAGYFESAIVPLWQGVYDALVERAGVRSGYRVLDVGTGTGEVAVRAARLAGPKGRVTGVDPQQEMLGIAINKARRLGLANVQFEQMNAEDLKLPDESFDLVVGNYSLCCVLDYDAALAECYRVLKPGGRVLYNHNGPGDPLQSQLATKVFEKYQTKKPSKKLRALRESDILAAEAVEKYRDPFVALGALRAVGFKDSEASITDRAVRYRTARNFVERMLAFDWRAEAEEMPKAYVSRMKEEAVAALAPMEDGQGFVIKDEMVFFSGTKR